MNTGDVSYNPIPPPGGGQVAGQDWVPGPDDEFLGYLVDDFEGPIDPELKANLKPGRWVPMGRRGKPGPPASPAPDAPPPAGG